MFHFKRCPLILGIWKVQYKTLPVEGICMILWSVLQEPFHHAEQQFGLEYTIFRNCANSCARLLLLAVRVIAFIKKFRMNARIFMQVLLISILFYDHHFQSIALWGEQETETHLSQSKLLASCLEVFARS